jgi:hypothetical protein
MQEAFKQRASLQAADYPFSQTKYYLKTGQPLPWFLAKITSCEKTVAFKS